MICILDFFKSLEYQVEREWIHVSHLRYRVSLRSEQTTTNVQD